MPHRQHERRQAQRQPPQESWVLEANQYHHARNDHDHQQQTDHDEERQTRIEAPFPEASQPCIDEHQRVRATASQLRERTALPTFQEPFLQLRPVAGVRVSVRR